MGTAVAERLLEADFPLVVYNRTPSKAEPLAARGATVAGSAADLAGETDVVLTSLSGEEARIVKLTINLMIAGLAQLMSEALVLGEAAGVSREALLEVMGSSAAGAPFVKYKTEPLLRDDYSATFTTALMEKDIDLILDAAEEHGVELPVARDLKGLLRAAVEAGHADDDFIALFLHLRSASRYSDQEVVR